MQRELVIRVPTPFDRLALLVKTRAGQIAVLCLLAVTVLWLRRPEQFSHPSIWVEDAYNLQQYSEHGFASLFDAIAGYLILASKLLAVPAFKLSIMWSPEILLCLTIAATAAVVLAIAFSPTHLRW